MTIDHLQLAARLRFDTFELWRHLDLGQTTAAIADIHRLRAALNHAEAQLHTQDGQR